MSNKERLEFLYNPKALLEYDNEKYLLGTDIPENTSKLLREAGANGRSDELAPDVDFDIDDREIINRLREDPLLMIKKMELRHMKIVEGFNKKKIEIESSGNHKINPDRKTKNRKSSLSRSPEGPASKPGGYLRNKRNQELNGKRPNKKVPKSSMHEKLNNMISYGKLIQSQRTLQFSGGKSGNPEESAQNSRKVSSQYLQEMRKQVDERQASSLGERMRFIAGNGIDR
ncbi:Pre-mRNA splicing factor family protein [Cryptosporidium felis]|nr:Pre-mRNA splicing factor family protein [Cryptosporidium felis]